MREFDFTEPQTVERWISQVESRWKTVPEYRVDPERLRHLAVICDGNRRSAQEKGFNPWQGHRVGVEVIKGIMSASKEWGIKHLTFWTWSTENWQRDKGQVDFVMRLAENYLRDEAVVNGLMEDKVRFSHFGRKDRLPIQLVKLVRDLEEKTSQNDCYYVNLAMDYGGIDEITRAIVKIADLMQEGILTEQDLLNNPGNFYQFLDTRNQPFPDLIVRTGMKEDEIPHTSGFMPIQSAYAGWMFSDELFPDLQPSTLCNLIDRFVEYERRFGK